MPNLVGIGNSQVPTNAMLGGLAYQDSVGEINLDKIKAKTGDTALDIFVYDTSKDSDGGAWRHRTQNKSWYDEGVSATRGARKEFPAVAVIVAEEESVSIYDGDDPNLPLWMKFNAGSGGDNIFNRPTAWDITAVFALNGIVCITNGANSAESTLVLNYVNDSARLYPISGYPTYGGDYTLGIAGRSSSLGDYTTIDQVIVGDETFDVAMTVQPNAPIDTSTELPVPTIAVGTGHGVSVIKDDGTISNLTPGGGVDMNSVSFDENNNLVMGRNNFILYRSDHSHYLSNQVDNGYTVNNRKTSVPSVGEDSSGSTSFTDVVATSDSSIAFDTQTLGLGLYDVNAENNSNSMVAYIRTNYNTGWMHGDIKGAFLSDTDDNNITGTELVSNPGPYSNTTGWTVANVGFTVSNSNNRLVINSTTNTGSYFGAGHALTLVSGKKYILTVNIHSQTKTAVIRMTGNGNYFTATGTGTGEHAFYFTANQASHNLFIGSDVGGNNRTQEVSSVSIKEVEEDRSVNNKGLQVFGTITKSAVATGAELIAYSGFTSGNYLQISSGVLGVNTSTDGPLTVMCWYKGTTTGAAQSLVIIGPASNHQGRGLLIKSNTGELGFFRWSNDPYSSRVVADDAWHHCVATVESGSRVKLYVDGDLVYNESITLVTSSSTRVRIGYSNGDNAPLVNGSLALVKISNSVASSDQIKKIYNDEKCLYHENAKCTLHGTSDNVKALAFDDTNDVLHVGTSSGRSDFRGLNRINNTTTAVTNAISASNEFVAEQ